MPVQQLLTSIALPKDVAVDVSYHKISLDKLALCCWSFYTTEEIYRRVVVDEEHLPAFVVGDELLLRARPLVETVFVKEIRQWWSKWVLSVRNLISNVHLTLSE